MKTLIALILLAPAVSWGLAFGPSTSGGGFVLSCTATPVGPATTELLDIYEGREVLRFTMAQGFGDISDVYYAGVDRTYAAQGHPTLAGELRAEILANLRTFFQSAKFVMTKAELPEANDLGDLPFIPSMCKVEQIAYFDDSSQTIYIYKALWDRLNSLSQAALVHHELFYRELRYLNDTTSKYARRAVAHVYASMGPLAVKDGLEPSSLAYDAIPAWQPRFNYPMDFSFYVTNFIASGLTRIQFDTIAGRPQLAKAWVDLPLTQWNLLLQRSPTGISCVVGTPNQDLSVEVPLNGTMVDGLSLRYEVKTGEPVTLILIKSGTELGSGQVAGGQNCEGTSL